MCLKETFLSILDDWIAPVGLTINITLFIGDTFSLKGSLVISRISRQVVNRASGMTQRLHRSYILP